MQERGEISSNVDIQSIIDDEIVYEQNRKDKHA